MKLQRIGPSSLVCGLCEVPEVVHVEVIHGIAGGDISVPLCAPCFCRWSGAGEDCDASDACDPYDEGAWMLGALLHKLVELLDCRSTYTKLLGEYTAARAALLRHVRSHPDPFREKRDVESEI